MKLYTHTYTGNPLADYMDVVAADLNSPIINNCIRIPSPIGKGCIRNILIEDDFCIRYFNFSLNENLLFKWMTDKEPEGVVFKLVFRLENMDNQAGVIAANTLPGCEIEKSTILYSTDFTRKGLIEKNFHVNRIVLLFAKSWLEENFSEASEKISEIVSILVNKNKPTFITEQMDERHYVFAQELARELEHETFPLLSIKTRSMVLLNDFLNKLMTRDAIDINSNQTLYYKEITKVENRLREYFDKPMPGINTLANEFNMSPSTLKRHFKIVYGKNIYTYYLEKKLAIGRDLIASRTKSVSEIAYTLGYAKINSFSKAFKKQYGYLPKDLNHMGGTL